VAFEAQWRERKKWESRRREALFYAPRTFMELSQRQRGLCLDSGLRDRELEASTEY